MARIVAERPDAITAIAEVFREHGYDGASLTLITAATGLGKGSLYHFFPGGKEEMAAAVLANIDRWFETEIFAPLRREDPEDAIPEMIRNVTAYFRSGRRVCLVGAFALSDVRDRFAAPIEDYFRRWVGALRAALRRRGVDKAGAQRRAEIAVAAIQGALVLSRALKDDSVFVRSAERLAAELLPPARPTDAGMPR